MVSLLTLGREACEGGSQPHHGPQFPHVNNKTLGEVTSEVLALGAHGELCSSWQAAEEQVSTSIRGCQLREGSSSGQDGTLERVWGLCGPLVDPGFPEGSRVSV